MNRRALRAITIGLVVSTSITVMSSLSSSSSAAATNWVQLDTASGRREDWAAALDGHGALFVRSRRDDGPWSPWSRQGTTQRWQQVDIEIGSLGEVWLFGLTSTGTIWGRWRTNAWSGWSVHGQPGTWAQVDAEALHDGIALLGRKKTGTVWVRTASPAMPERPPVLSAFVRHGQPGVWRFADLEADRRFPIETITGISIDGQAIVMPLGGDTTSAIRAGAPDEDWVALDTAISGVTIWMAAVSSSGDLHVVRSGHDGWRRWGQMGSAGTWASVSLFASDYGISLYATKTNGATYRRTRPAYPEVPGAPWSEWTRADVRTEP